MALVWVLASLEMAWILVDNPLRLAMDTCTEEQEVAMLEERAQMLESELDNIKKRLEKLKKKEAKNA